MPGLEPNLRAMLATLRRWAVVGNRRLAKLNPFPGLPLRRMVGTLVNVILAVLFGFLLYHNRALLPLVARLVTPAVVGSCLLLDLASLLLQFANWQNLMGYQQGERGQALEDYIRTIFMGRLPGGIWKLVGRMTLYRGPRLSSTTILAINVVEVLLLLSANAGLLLILSPLDWRLRYAGLFLLLLLLLALARKTSAMLPQVFAHHSPMAWLRWIAGYTGAWLCGGMIVYLVVAPFGATITFVDALRYWCIAGAAAVVLEVLPLSTLLRDATLVTLLQQTMSLQNAIVAAFALRLMLTVGDLASGWTLLGLDWLIRRRPLGLEAQPRD